MVKNSRQVKSIIKSLINSLNIRGVEVNRIILFGSYAHGKPKPDSDIDLAVISRSFNSKGLLKRQELLGEAIFQLRGPIEAIGFSYKEYQKRHPLSFLADIVSKGKVVYEE